MESSNRSMEYYTNFPFEFIVANGRSAGARIEIAPGNRTADSDSFVNIDERSFWFIEYFICSQLIDDHSFSHFGENLITMSIWHAALQDGQAYLNTVNDPLAMSEAWNDRGYIELGTELKARPDRTLSGLKSLIANLIDRSVIWSASY